MDPVKIFAVEVFNLNTSAIFPGQPVPKGCLGVTVDREPKMLYRQVGRHFIAEDSGIISVLSHAPGTKDGFAGRTFTLPVIGQGKVFSQKGVTHKRFKGDLWDSHEGTKAAVELLGQPVRSIGVRVFNSGCYVSYRCTQEFIDRIARVVVIGKSEMSPLI